MGVVDGSILPAFPERVRANTLDAEVTPVRALDVARMIRSYALAGHGIMLGNLNLHGVYMLHTDPDFRAHYGVCDLVLIDGAPIAWASRVSTEYRVGSTDWLDALMPMSQGLKILAVGGSPETARNTEKHMRENYPASWVGIDGFAGREITQELVDQIQASQIVLVGMGMPLQERWILENQEHLQGKVVANVGGCLDYYAGTQPLAPRWMGRLGLEWVYRLARDPRRLSQRYLVEPFKLAGVLMRNRKRSSG